MEEKRQFYQLLKPVRRQLLIKRSFVQFHYWLLAASVFTVLLLLAARLFVIPFYHEMVWYGCFLLLILFIFLIWRSRPGWREAAQLFNTYIPEDRVITALFFIDDDGVLKKLQLAEAITLMKKEQQHVLARKKGYFLPKWLFIAAVFAFLSILLNYFPNHNLQLAAKKETEIAVMKKVEKKLEEKAKKEQNPEVKKMLEKAKEIMTKNPTTEDALLDLAKQKKELELKALKEQEKQENLKAWQQELKNADLNKLAAALEAKDNKKIKKELEQLTQKYDSLTESQKKALSKLSGSDKKLSEKELAVLAKKISDALNSDNAMKELADAQAALGEASDNLQNEMLASGLQSNQLALNPPTQSAGGKTTSPNSKNENPTSTPKGSDQGKQSSKNGAQGNAAGNGNGAGNGAGIGNGNGSGSGTGTGSGNGNGRGAGLGAGSRQLLTIPEKLAGKNNLESDSGTIGKGSPTEQFVGNGPILKGQLRSYQEVYGNYAAAYRNSTDRVKLPSDLEAIVKNYFLLLDPNKE
ncbi:hypothetical protein BACCIP111895_00420 [Neobacillus rhizosphaerae]|uniref:Uncharacterized protein n=1 Tax=Neobacillus rhizosphaerae TaxID=2880965 RepID=A0ABM9EME6_9BACI|nr:hypothetical protein [Neobacillus rhizosphaerae]CAH2713285.1 hypothetical protein BACCIP111895_00420 [Neobacillus rhizosphaerae]